MSAARRGTCRPPPPRSSAADPRMVAEPLEGFAPPDVWAARGRLHFRHTAKSTLVSLLTRSRHPSPGVGGPWGRIVAAAPRQPTRGRVGEPLEGFPLRDVWTAGGRLHCGLVGKIPVKSLQQAFYWYLIQIMGIFTKFLIFLQYQRL